jgi:hypothetical protein
MRERQHVAPFISAFMLVKQTFRPHSRRLRHSADGVAALLSIAIGSAPTRHPTHVRRRHMPVTKILGLAAVGALLALAAPANAISLINPGAAAAVQEDTKLATTDVHWRHHRHHRWHRHHRHHRHWRW